MSHESHEVVITDDPAEFLALAGEHLAADPVLTTVVSTVTHRALAQVERGLPAPAITRAGGPWSGTRPAGSWGSRCAPRRSRRTRCSCCRCRTRPPWPWPGRVHARGEEIGGANGALPATQVVADEAARLQGVAASVWEHTRLFELGELVEPKPVEGRMRRAGADDTGLCLAWFQAFAADAAEQAGRTEGEGHEEYFTREDMLERIDGGRIWLWEVAGEPVHLTGFNPPSFGVARVGPGLHAEGAPRPRLRQRRCVRGVPAAARRRDPGLPLHRPGQPHVQPDLPGAGLPARRGHGELRGRLTPP